MLSNLEGTVSDPYISGFLNFQPINNIYIYMHSGSIGNYNSLSCDGSQTVIKKYPLHKIMGLLFMIRLFYLMIIMIVLISLKTLEFQLKTARGDQIPLHGCNINFSLIFTLADTTV